MLLVFWILYNFISINVLHCLLHCGDRPYDKSILWFHPSVLLVGYIVFKVRATLSLLLDSLGYITAKWLSGDLRLPNDSESLVAILATKIQIQISIFDLLCGDSNVIECLS